MNVPRKILEIYTVFKIAEYIILQTVHIVLQDIKDYTFSRSK